MTSSLVSMWCWADRGPCLPPAPSSPQFIFRPFEGGKREMKQREDGLSASFCNSSSTRSVALSSSSQGVTCTMKASFENWKLAKKIMSFWDPEMAISGLQYHSRKYCWRSLFVEYLIDLNKLNHPCTTEGQYSSVEVSARRQIDQFCHRVDKHLLYSVRRQRQTKLSELHFLYSVVFVVKNSKLQITFCGVVFNRFILLLTNWEGITVFCLYLVHKIWRTIVTLGGRRTSSNQLKNQNEHVCILDNNSPMQIVDMYIREIVLWSYSDLRSTISFIGCNNKDSGVYELY